MSAAREVYIVDSDGWTDEQCRDRCRECLRVVASEAARYECDFVPSQEWPPDARGASEVLRSAARKHQSDPTYTVTGVLPNDDPDRWQAFVTIAPWALDASVWSEGGAHLASLADMSQSIALELTEEKRRMIAEIVGQSRLLTKAEHNRARRASKRRT